MYAQPENDRPIQPTPAGTTITIRGEKFELTDRQLEEAANRVASEPKVGGIEAPKLRSYIERIERLEEDKAGIASDIRDVKAEAKSNGFDMKAIAQILKLRKMKANERTEQEYMLDLYLRALGMQRSFEFEQEETPGQVEPQTDLEEAVFYDHAKKIVIAHRKASTSYIQRMLGIGYNRAARLIELMEREGVIGPANHVGKREVLHPAPAEEPA